MLSAFRVMQLLESLLCFCTYALYCARYPLVQSSRVLPSPDIFLGGEGPVAAAQSWGEVLGCSFFSGSFDLPIPVLLLFLGLLLFMSHWFSVFCLPGLAFGFYVRLLTYHYTSCRLAPFQIPLPSPFLFYMTSFVHIIKTINLL